MNKRTHVIAEYEFTVEALPIVLAGVLLNVGGRQIAEYAEVPLIFVDMIGTAFCAILLGPWWAAAVAAATTTINGNFFTNYFAFGLVNITGGLVWGYLSRGLDLKHKMLEPGRGQASRILGGGILLASAGGFACALTSSLVKLVLYPPMGRPLLRSDNDLATESVLTSVLGFTPPAHFSLMATDLWRDLLDKFVSVPIAIVFALLLGGGAMVAASQGRLAAAQRWRTDMVSIFAFVLLYSVYILLARLLMPELTFNGAERSIFWLREPSVVILLFLPLAVAAPAMVLLTYRPNDPADCRVDINRQIRRQAFRTLYNRPLATTLEGVSFSKIAANISSANKLMQRFGLQPLALAISIWSLRNSIGNQWGVAIALVLALIALAAYFLVARAIYPRLGKVVAGIGVVRRWLASGGDGAGAAQVLNLLKMLLQKRLTTMEGPPARRGELVYALGFDRPSGQSANERIALLGVFKSPGALDRNAATLMEEVARNSGANVVALVTTTTRVRDPEVAQRLRAVHNLGAEIWLFDWIDLVRGVAAYVLGRSPEQAVLAARSRFLAALSDADEPPADQASNIDWLAARALPSLRLIFEQAPRGRRVFDMGCGFGRHAVAAVKAGHSVACVEKQEHVAARARENLSAAGVPAPVVICGDMTELKSAQHGFADIVVNTGVMQHAASREELTGWLDHMAGLAAFPGAVVFIEMLFNMRFDGAPKPGRLDISPAEFEALLRERYPAPRWQIEICQGPVLQSQSYKAGSRSFDASGSSEVESTTAEYAIWRLQ